MTERVPVEFVRKLGKYSITATDMQGQDWVLRRRFAGDSCKLITVLGRIRAAGTIDLAHWRRPNRAGW